MGCSSPAKLTNSAVFFSLTRHLSYTQSLRKAGFSTRLEEKVTIYDLIYLLLMEPHSKSTVQQIKVMPYARLSYYIVGTREKMRIKAMLMLGDV